MRRDVFAQRLHAASARTRQFAQGFIEETLPEAMVFRVRLNASYDGNPLHADERVFPADSSADLARRLSRCTAEEVIDVLWRDGLVPEWINVAVIGESDTATLVELLCCGRYTANEQLLYHERQGLSPFQVVGPTLPVNFEDGGKFSIYERCCCWSREELSRVAPHASKVRSLDLYGADFDDDLFAELPPFDRLHVLDLKVSPLTGRGLAGLSRQSTLHHVRIALNHAGPFTAAHLPHLPSLSTLTVVNLPRGEWGFPAVAAQTTLRDLSLTTDHDLVLDARMSSGMRSVSLTAPSVQGDPLPDEIVSLDLHLREAGDADIERLVARLRSVTHLSLIGARVGDELVESLADRWKLDYLNVTNTLVGESCLRRMRDRHTAMRLHPAPDPPMPKGRY